MKKQAELGLNLSTKRARKVEFLDEVELVVHWRELIALITATSPVASTGHPPFAQETMLRIHLLQQWFGLSEQAVTEALFEAPLYQDFADLPDSKRTRDRVRILHFGKNPNQRHLREEYELSLQTLAPDNSALAAKGLLIKNGTAIDATLIAAPSSPNNKDRELDPEIHQTKKGNQWHVGMKALQGLPAKSMVVGTAANVNDVTQAHALVYEKETDVFANSGYQGVGKCDETQDIEVNWHVAMRPGKRKALAHQAPIRLCEGSLQRPGEEHGATPCAVRALRLDDGIAPAICIGLGNECACSALLSLDDAKKNCDKSAFERWGSMKRMHRFHVARLMRSAGFVMLVLNTSPRQTQRSRIKS